jgi:NAD(P)-dependent dehydrogenase (short-subunit alcohol dehydrogenase family)/rhamnose utilization protein RhaD (predicted bifunctional aldolase and dehydrogenase)
MEKEYLAQLIEVSRAVGTNPDYIQAGGGNTSVKSADGRTMAIKASGTALALMSESAGWVEMDLSRVLTVLDRPELPALPSKEREALVLDHLTSAVVGTLRGRPSVESALHALLGRVVIHTHSVAINALTCGPGEPTLRELTRPGELPAVWIPYTDPGWKLATAIRSAARSYQQKHGRLPAVIFLENHGIFVSADSPAACLALHEDWVRRCERHFAPSSTAAHSLPPLDSAALRSALAALRKSWREARGTPLFVRLSDNLELCAAATGPVCEAMAAGSLTPDHIVYNGAHALLVESLDDLPAQLKPALGEPAWPRVAFVRGLGALLLADDPLKLEAVEVVAAGGARIHRLAAARGGAKNLAPAAADFIINWEAEHYRARISDSACAALAGRIALVTGAASGLGLGIAHGLVEAGAAVAFCDVDEPGAAAAAAASADPRRAFPVRMDVTDERSVAAAFDKLLRRWGGVDLTVCAAGIAPAFELVDMPLDKWRLALEINLTGYFLVAREAARIMKAQGSGGAMVMVSSKTGLDASKANSAYNATKAGELHLVRGWALELGKDGIRVNSVAPGNVFEGSKIWNADYIKTCARKRNIRPEEVIPYYNSLTALGREIKRSDVAGAVVFLCSDQARCITGQTLVVDSGQVMVR